MYWKDIRLMVANKSFPKFKFSFGKSERVSQIPYDITYMCYLKYATNEHICKTETDLQTQRLDVWFPRGRRMGEGMIGSLGLAVANSYT